MLRTRMTGDEAIKVAKRVLFTSAAWVGVAALALAIAAVPADAKKRRKSAQTKVEQTLPDPNNGEPMTLVVSLSQQKVDVYRGLTLVTSSGVSTGMRGYATKAGVFSILEKKRMHHSNLYSGAPMPYMQRVTWSGTALHAGVLPGYPASHGCIRLPFSFAPKLFRITSVGEHVVVTRDRPAPQLIEHSALFQPLPPPSVPIMVKQEPVQRQSSLDMTPAPMAFLNRVVLARADVGVITDVPSIEVPAAQQAPSVEHAPLAPAPLATDDHATVDVPASSEGSAAPSEDTRVHAIDPNGPSSDGGASHAIATETNPAADHALQDSMPSDPQPNGTTTSVATAPADASLPASAAAEPAAAAVPAVETAPAPAAAVVPPAAIEAVPAAALDPAMPAPVTPAITAPALASKPSTAVVPAAAMAAPPAPIPAAASPDSHPATPVVATAPAADLVPATAKANELVTTPEPAAAPSTANLPEAPVTPAPVATAPADVAAPVQPAVTEPAVGPGSAPAPVATEASQPSAPSGPPSVIMARLDAGAAAAGIEAAEPRSTAPLRILVTRRTQHDRIIDVQYTLSDLGYLERQNFDGTLGKQTVNAIKAFQKDQNLAPSGAFNEDLVKKLYAVAGKEEPPIGHLFVRQEFARMFDAPVNFRNPDEPLGTHVFTAMKFAPGDTKTQWMAISLVGDNATDVLDRLEIPADVRQKISQRLTPGSSLIIGDLAINSATLPKGADFLVWAKNLPAKVTAASLGSDLGQPRAKKKKYRTVKRVKKKTYTYQYPRPAARSYPGWPW